MKRRLLPRQTIIVKRLVTDATKGDPRAPLVSPLFSDLGGLPPALIQVGGEEVLLSDALGLAEKLGLAEFQKAFNIPDSSPMVRAADKRVNIW